MMLFLGAGASKRFGIKTMKEMSKKFEDEVDKLPDVEKVLYSIIRDNLHSNNLEYILTVLNDLANPSNPTGCFIASLSVTDNITSTLTSILKSVRLIAPISEESIKEMGNTLANVLSRIYGQLFEILKIKSSIIFDIFTTNYDLIIAFTASGSVGFGDDYVWNPKGYDEIIEYANNKDIPTLRDYEGKSILDASGNDIENYLGDWYIRKVLNSAKSDVRPALVAFKKFFKFLYEKRKSDELLDFGFAGGRDEYLVRHGVGIAWFSITKRGKKIFEVLAQKE